MLPSSFASLFTERFASIETPRRRAVLLLRWTLFASLLGMGVTSPHAILDVLLIDLILTFLLAINLVVSFVPERVLQSNRMEFSLGLLDTVVISFVLYESDPSGYLCLFFFVLLTVTAVATRAGQFLVTAVAMSSLYLLLQGPQALQISNLLVLPVFYAGALHFGYQVLQIRTWESRTEAIDRERRDLRVILRIIDSITSSVDFHTVMYQIVSRFAEILDAIRCSLVLIENEDEDHGFVVAASDSRDLNMLPIDLSRYPEIRRAIQSRSPVIIEDVERCRMLRPVLDDLRRLNFHSLVVLPLLFKEEVIGTLFLRATRKRRFPADEIRLCKAVASAAASAIKNSMLYRLLKQRAQEQEQLAAHLRSLFDNSPDLILRVDPEGIVREANRMVERAAGRPAEKILSRDVGDLIQGLPSYASMLDAAAASASPRVLDAALQTADERNLQLSVTVGPVEDPQGGLILIARDVTEQRRVQARLQQKEKLSRIGEIVAGVAHELNNPLSGIVGFAELLRLKELPAEVERDVDRIVDCAGRCQKIVQNLLSFSRPSSADRTSLCLNGIVERTLDQLGLSLSADHIRIVKNLEADLPPVLADFHQLQQVLTNLLTNAHQAIGASSRGGCIELCTFTGDGKLVLTISDDGPGIPPEVLPQIFDPFFSTKAQGKGTGLGLSISYGIVQDHGGELRVDTQVGRGTAFSVILPISTQDHAGEEPAHPEEHVAGRARRILAVDDEPVIVDLYLEILRALGHTVDTAATGLEALRKIRTRDYDLVLSDIKMPKMSGVELYEKVRELKPEMADRFVFITGDVNFLSDKQHSSIRGIPCLLKPVSLDAIESTIRAVLPAGDSSSD